MWVQKQADHDLWEAREEIVRAIVLVGSQPNSIQSYKTHFFDVRVRFFAIGLLTSVELGFWECRQCGSRVCRQGYWLCRLSWASRFPVLEFNDW